MDGALKAWRGSATAPLFQSALASCYLLPATYTAVVFGVKPLLIQGSSARAILWAERVGHLAVPSRPAVHYKGMEKINTLFSPPGGRAAQWQGDVAIAAIF